VILTLAPCFTGRMQASRSFHFGSPHQKRRQAAGPPSSTVLNVCRHRHMRCFRAACNVDFGTVLHRSHALFQGCVQRGLWHRASPVACSHHVLFILGPLIRKDVTQPVHLALLNVRGRRHARCLRADSGGSPSRSRCAVAPLNICRRRHARCFRAGSDRLPLRGLCAVICCMSVLIDTRSTSL
jgi:hypothetical protein